MTEKSCALFPSIVDGGDRSQPVKCFPNRTQRDGTLRHTWCGRYELGGHKHFVNLGIKATDVKGRPHPVLRSFADHLAKHLIAPSARFSGRVGSRVWAGVAGRFTYEPPEGVKWSP